MARKVACELAGNVTCRSRSGTLLPQAHRGVRRGDTWGLDMMRGPRTGTFAGMHMGRPAEQLSVGGGNSRADQDACALEPHCHAARAVGESHVRTAPPRGTRPG
jgi:acetyl-CoA acetyltransferase